MGHGSSDLLALLALGSLAIMLILYAASLPATRTAFALDSGSPVRFDGFYGLEQNADGPFRWAKPQAMLALPVNRPSTYRITLALQDGSGVQPPRTATIRVADTEQRVQLGAARRDYSITTTIESRAWADARGTIVVRLETAAFQPTGDPRVLGVVLGRVMVEPAAPAWAWDPELVLALIFVLALYWMARRLGLPVIWATGVIALALLAYGGFALGARADALQLAYLPSRHLLPSFIVLQLLIALPLAARDQERHAETPRLPRLPDLATWQRTIIVALLLLVCYGSFRQASGWNEYSRYDLVQALVVDRSTRIDAYAANTGDTASYNGHIYSDKAPGAAFLGVPAYALLRGILAYADAGEPTPARALPVLTFAGAGLPTVALVLLLLHFLRPLVGEGWALVVSLGYGLGTIAWPFATMYFGHAAAASFLFAAFYALWRVRQGGGAWWSVLAGFLAGWAVLAEFPAALGVAVLLIYAYWVGRRAPALMLLGAVPPALLLGWYNWVSFGGPFALGYAHLADGQFAAGMSRGILGITLPKPAALGALLLDTRGLLRLSPWLTFAPLGLWAARRAELRGEVLLCLGIGLVFLLYNAGYYLPFGGWTPGPRFLIPALPFLAVLAALAPRRLRPLLALEIAAGVALCGLATVTMPNADEALRDPLRQLWWPQFLAAHLAPSTAQIRWGLGGLTPLVILILAAALAFVALLVAGRPRPFARNLAWLLAASLLAIVLGFGLPIDGGAASAPVAPAGEGHLAGASASSFVREVWRR